MELLEEPVIAPPIYEGKLRGELLVPKYNLTKEQKNELKKFREMIENNSEIQPLNEKQVLIKKKFSFLFFRKNILKMMRVY